MIFEFLGIFLNENAFITACIEIFTGIILALLTRNLYQRYKQRKSTALRYLTLTTFFLSLTSLLQLLDQFIFDPFTEIEAVGYGLAFGMSAVGNIFMAWFMLEIFSSGRASGGGKLKLFVIIEGLVAVLSPIFGPLRVPFPEPFLMVLLVHLVFSLILYFTFIKVTTGGIKKTSDPIARKGFVFLRFGGVMIASAYISFILDSVWFQVFAAQYSFWVMLGWLFAAAAGILLYQGFIHPTKTRAQTESAGKKEASEKDMERIEKLKTLVKVSRVMKIQQLAMILDMSESELYKYITDWAKQFGFIIDRDEVDFTGGRIDDFIITLEKEFEKWGKDGKQQ